MKKINNNTTTQNIIGISTMGLAQAMAGGFVGIYISIFYTDILGISAAAMGFLLLIARLWDSFNDPVVGMIMDNSRIRIFGHYKFFLVVGNIIMSILTILMFTAPNFSITGKITYAYITYFTWSLAYTMMPVMPLTAAVINNPKDRSYVAGTQRIVILIVGFTTAAFMPLVEKFGGGSIGFTYAISIFMFPLMLVSLIGTLMVKEPAMNIAREKIQFKDIYYLFSKNKPMRIFAIYIFISGLIMPFMNAALAYYVKYTYGIEKMIYIMPLAMGGFIVGVVFSIITSKFIDRKKLLTYAHFIQTILFMSLYFFTPDSFIIAFILIGIIDFSMGLTVIPDSTMSMEIMDYNQYKEGKRMAGVISCMHLFLTKPQGAFAGATIGFMLSSIGFIADMKLTPTLSNVLLLVCFLLPAIFAIISMGIIQFYPINEEKAQFYSTNIQS